MAVYQTMIGGHKMPTVGLGTWNASSEQEIEDAIDRALEIGYRHIDTAYLYQNEAAIGRALKRWLSSGKIKREELFVTTKLPMEGMYEDKVQEFLDKSLEDLQLDYVDLYLIHQPIACVIKDGKPVFGPTDHLSIWRGMEKMIDLGKTKTIGLSNFNVRQVEKVWNNSRIKPACNQIELSPYIQQKELVDFCQKKNIVVVAYSSFGSPGRSNPGIGVRAAAFEIPNILGDETIKKIAEKHNKTTGQVILRFFVQKNIVVIPKSTNFNRLKENFDVFNFNLEHDEIKAIEGLDKGESGRTMDTLIYPELKDHPEYPWK